LQPSKPVHQNASKLVLLMLGILLLLLLVSFLMRYERGLLGLALTVAAILLGFYWFKEIKKAAARYRSAERFPFELVEEGGMIMLTAQVPGPERDVSVEVIGRKLLIRGGRGFRKAVKLPYHAVLLSSSYINGVLHVRLVRDQEVMKRE